MLPGGCLGAGATGGSDLSPGLCTPLTTLPRDEDAEVRQGGDLHPSSSLQDPPQTVCSQRTGLSWAASLGCWKERPSPAHLSHRLLSRLVLAFLLSPCRISGGLREQSSASTQHSLVLPSSLKCETMGTEYVISFLESLHVPAEPHLNVSLFLFPQANGILGTTVLITPISAVRLLLEFVPWEPENKDPCVKAL